MRTSLLSTFAYFTVAFVISLFMYSPELMTAGQTVHVSGYDVVGELGSYFAITLMVAPLFVIGSVVGISYSYYKETQIA